MRDHLIDLDLLDLRSGQATTLTPEVRPEPPVLGGERYAIEAGQVPATVDVSRTTSGYALRLQTEVAIAGPCARCTEPARIELAVEAREVDQPGTEDEELRSPYVSDSVLDVESWLHDAIILSLPEKILCRPDCAGLCEVCGVSLNEVGPDHSHERPPDPRFAKLRELSDPDDGR